LKSTGVSRRIDDLGRIVIPKEIRKNLKIRNGELMEIMVNDDSIILSKHSTIKGIGDVAQLIVDSLNDSMEINLIITDRDKVVAATSTLRKKYENQELNTEYSELILKRQTVTEQNPAKIKIDNENEEETSYIIYPIIADGDVVGSVLVLGLDNKIKEIDGKIAEIVSKFLSRNIM